VTPAGFISDLHLEQPEEPRTAILRRFLQGPARQLRQLYILGDLFEAWIGDDARDPLGERLVEDFAQLAASGVAMFLQHGNRDFLLGDDFCRRAGVRRLPDPCVIDLAGRPCLISHGDAWCTDDVAYQQFRSQVRNPSWQAAFLAQPVEARRAYARQARQQSAAHQREAPMALMDVNASRVDEVFALYGIDLIIHGHTHRPAEHIHAVRGRHCERWVLADWREQGEALMVDADGPRRLSLS